MITPHHNRCFQLSLFYQIIHRQSELRALAIAEPADPRGQALKLNPLTRQVNPTAKNLILGKEFEHQIVRPMNVRRFARERHPTERAPAFAKQRSNIRGNKSRKVVSVLDSALERRCLVSENVWYHSALGKFRNNVGAVPYEADRDVFFFTDGILEDT